MKIMVFDVGGTEIKYSVMDEQMHRTDSGAVPTPQDTQAQFLDTVYRLYAPYKDEVTGIAMALPGFVDNRTGYVPTAERCCTTPPPRWGSCWRKSAAVLSYWKMTARPPPWQSWQTAR